MKFENLHFMQSLRLKCEGVLTTVGWYSGSANDALRHWLSGNGFDWQYDQLGRLWFHRSGLPWMSAAFKVIGHDPVDGSAILRIFKLVP